MAQLGSACDDVGVVGEYPEDDEHSESDLERRLVGISVERGERQGEEEVMGSVGRGGEKCGTRVLNQGKGAGRG